MAEKLKNIVKIIEELAPLKAAESWDNVGIQVGGMDDEVQKVLVTLDVTDKVIEEAIEKEIDLIISHHPFIFKGMKRILKDDPKGRLLYQMIQNNISVYATHTNIDVVTGGLNDQLAFKIGIEASEILQVTNRKEYYKLVVFVPVAYQEEVAEALAMSAAGHIGNYSHCSFRAEGIGAFKPLDGSNPFIGNKGDLEKVEEIRLETIVPKEGLSRTIEAMIQAHPYEEVAYDVYPLVNLQADMGIGRVGNLSNPTQAAIFIEEIKATLGIDKLKFTGNVNDTIERVAVVNGSGADYIADAIKAKCDCLITGDVKYHDAQMALDNGLMVIDIGHFESEMLFVEWLTDYMTVKCSDGGLQVEMIPTATYINPFQFL